MGNGEDIKIHLTEWVGLCILFSRVVGTKYHITGWDKTTGIYFPALLEDGSLDGVLAGLVPSGHSE